MDIREIIWRNVLALMQHHYGKENLTRLAEDCGWSPNQGSLIKKQQTYLTLKTLIPLCSRFNIEPWMLLHPDFDPANPPSAVLNWRQAAALEALRRSQVDPKDPT